MISFFLLRSFCALQLKAEKEKVSTSKIRDRPKKYFKYSQNIFRSGALPKDATRGKRCARRLHDINIGSVSGHKRLLFVLPERNKFTSPINLSGFCVRTRNLVP